jgi:hypothetical protein
MTRQATLIMGSKFMGLKVYGAPSLGRKIFGTQALWSLVNSIAIRDFLRAFPCKGYATKP